MQRERERATPNRWKHVPKLPCLVVLAFYCVLYVYTVSQSLRRQDGHLVNTECDAPLTVAGDCKLYELAKSPLGLPFQLANFSKLAVDYILIGEQTRYTYNKSEPFLRVLGSGSDRFDTKRQAPLGEYQFYSDPGLWERLDAAVRPTRFPQECFGKRLRTLEWSLEAVPAWDDRLFEMIGKLGQILPLFLVALIPRGFCRWSKRESMTWNVALGFVFCFLGHGLMGGGLLMTWAGANFMLARTCARRPFALAVTWSFNLPIMLLGFRYLGPLDYWDNFCGGGPEQELRYAGRCSDLHKALHWTVEELPFMVGFAGLCPWHSIRFVTLRMIAFFIDYVHAIRDTPPGLRLENKPDLIVRQETNLPLYRYTFGHCVAYLFYPPLYWGGPIINFNAFVSQVYEPQGTYSAKEVTIYCFRLALTALVTVICLHFNYASVLLYRKTPPPVRHDIGVWEMWGLVHWMLQYQWLSLVVLWRLSRAVALLDGIDVPENMGWWTLRRC
ncbi:unnamed protein product [Prorocentrum cordatum]|uniref:Uncharacterized protein n=1 Tax=Prorocentrum cordatum TaxID=2364126 RepID=A0ABN9XD26_9DINO|nr:unnamed protein product [Polarella glacialis]